jgi:hypothetical protein
LQELLATTLEVDTTDPIYYNIRWMEQMMGEVR